MKTHIASLLLGLLLAVPSSLVAQSGGPLTPPGIPGNPATVMPSLTEIYNAAKETRTVIPAQSATFTISQPGSYVLGGDISVATGDGVVIASGGVTLDLNGFAIKSTAAPSAGNAVTINSGSAGVRIHDGRLNSAGGTGFLNGIIYNPTGGTTNLVFEGLSFAGGLGINIVNPAAGASPIAAVARRCSFASGGVVFSGSFSGTWGKVIDCEFNGGGAVAAVVENCSGLIYQPHERTVIPASVSPVTISLSGSYLLGGDITVSAGHGINIVASNVTLDLNGFRISSSEATPASAAILIGNTVRNVTVRNGRITSGYATGGDGFLRGIELALAVGSDADGFVFEDLQILGVNGLAIGLTNSSTMVNTRRVVARRVLVKGQDGIILVQGGSSQFGKVIDCDVTTNSSLVSVGAGLVGQCSILNQGTGSALSAPANFNNHVSP